MRNAQNSNAMERDHEPGYEEAEDPAEPETSADPTETAEADASGEASEQRKLEEKKSSS